MNLPDYQVLDIHKQRAGELVQAAARRTEMKQLCGPKFRQQLACFIGHKLLRLGKQLLAYGELNKQRNVNKTAIV